MPQGEKPQKQDLAKTSLISFQLPLRIRIPIDKEAFLIEVNLNPLLYFWIWKTLNEIRKRFNENYLFFRKLKN